MKRILKISQLIILGLVILLPVVQSCDKADPMYEHPTNTISAMIMSATHGGYEWPGDIKEYNAKGELLEPGFTQAQAEGGWGMITFRVSEGSIDLTNVYLKASLVYDEIVSPALAGRHDILVTDKNPEGKLFSVKSGMGTVRKYRVMGYYD